MIKQELNKDVFIIDNFLSENECQQFILDSEKLGYREATVSTLEGPKMMKMIRNNQRVISIDLDLASLFWERIKPFVFKMNENWFPKSVNEQFRYYKYEVGERFNKHRDGKFVRNEWEESKLTIIVYLNNGFEGGETEFDDFVVTPKPGTALVFIHHIKHKGCKVSKGIKYALRTDVMYSKEIK